MEDAGILVNCIQEIITGDFEKIKKLTYYLKNVAVLLNVLELPIVWSLPSGLTITQSYMETRSTSISPFMYSKAKINLRLSIRDKFDKRKQVRALMPNLIHSLDASSLVLLYSKFSNIYNNPQFYSVHDCFGTTMDKVENLKTLLASVYTDLYSRDNYLDKFDKCILDHIENSTPEGTLDRKKRTVKLPNFRLKNDVYHIHDIEWVKNKKIVDASNFKKIESQYILI